MQPVESSSLPYSMRSQWLLAPALAALLSGCDPQWGTIESKEGGFRVYMPTPTEKIDVEGTTENGTFRWLGYGREGRSLARLPWLDDPSDPYVRAESLDIRTLAPHLRADADARALEYPEAALLPPGPDRFKPFEISACKGLELYVPGEYGHARRRACIVGDHLYLLSMIGSEDEVNGERARRFFESLEILPTHQ